jgi:hypothetical protein
VMSFRNYDFPLWLLAAALGSSVEAPTWGVWAKYNYEVGTLVGILSPGEREAHDSLFKSSPHPHNPLPPPR